MKVCTSKWHASPIVDKWSLFSNFQIDHRKNCLNILLSKRVFVLSPRSCILGEVHLCCFLLGIAYNFFNLFNILL